jgi:GNAT superfamily N-acetyltransferase
MTGYKIAVEAEPDGGDIAALVQGLTAFNAAHLDGEVPDYLLITIRDAEGKLLGGLLGATYVKWLQVQVVWMEDALRGGGYGSQLMALAEQEALRRGCSNAFVETFSFQALPFYERCGYKIFSGLPDFPPGGTRYALTKALG